jgi:elongation factor P
MKTAQECRSGNVILIEGSPWVILKAEFTKSGRNASVVKMKLKNLLNGVNTETVYRADDKFEDIQLDRKEVSYSYYADPMHVFMDEEYNQYEINQDDLEDLLPWIEDGMTDLCDAVFYEGRVISITAPATITREVAYAEPAARGDTSGKVTKVARLKNGTELNVAAFIEIGERILIDTRTGEYKSRAKD